MKRWVLVSARTGRPRRLLPVLVALAGLAGVWGVGAVLASDPVAYGVPFWPFADSVDLAEQRLMSFVAGASRAGESVETSEIQVLARTENARNVFLTLRLNIDGETRCREAIISAPGFSSRRVNCHALGPLNAER